VPAAEGNGELPTGVPLSAGPRGERSATRDLPRGVLTTHVSGRRHTDAWIAVRGECGALWRRCERLECCVRSAAASHGVAAWSRRCGVGDSEPLVDEALRDLSGEREFRDTSAWLPGRYLVTFTRACDSADGAS
jgi:hypothetical protein